MIGVEWPWWMHGFVSELLARLGVLILAEVLLPVLGTKERVKQAEKGGSGRLSATSIANTARMCEGRGYEEKQRKLRKLRSDSVVPSRGGGSTGCFRMYSFKFFLKGAELPESLRCSRQFQIVTWPRQQNPSAT